MSCTGLVLCARIAYKRLDELEVAMHEVGEKVLLRRRVRVERGIYRQANGKYAVCFMLDGKACFRTVGSDLEQARAQRLSFVRAARFGVVAAAPRLRLETVAGWWLERYERRVEHGERRVRTLEIHTYYLKRHVLPQLGHRLIREITADDVADLLDRLRERGFAAKTAAGTLQTLNNVMRFAVRNNWVAQSPVEKLERHERPRPERHPQRVLGREEITRLLGCCLPPYRTLVATALYTGMRLSELLGLIWEDIDLDRGQIHVRAQLSRAHVGSPAQRVAPKTRAAVRQIPLTPQLAGLLRERTFTAARGAGNDWVFATRSGTPLSQRNIQRSALHHAADAASLRLDGAQLRFHDLRHTFASHLVIDLGLDVVQVSRILGHASPSTTLDIYAHMFDEARHAADIRARMAHSAFAGLLENDQDDRRMITLPVAAGLTAGPLSARQRAAIKWAT
jgi:integrase